MDFTAFKQRVKARFNLDLESYKEKQLQRRIMSLMGRRNITDFAVYFRLLEGDAQARSEFFDYITINVTEFFRDPRAFATLEKDVLPRLLAGKPVLKVWSAACSNGAEPYSVTILLDELSPGRRHRIEATDIDARILQVAMAGRYAADLLRNVSPARRTKYFRAENGTFTVIEDIKRRVNFRRHDLLTDAYGAGYDLIICRNVQIYFTREAQHRINSGFARALNPGGVLFLGASESIFEYRELGFERVAMSFYIKR